MYTQPRVGVGCKGGTGNERTLAFKPFCKLFAAVYASSTHLGHHVVEQAVSLEAQGFAFGRYKLNRSDLLIESCARQQKIKIKRNEKKKQGINKVGVKVVCALCRVVVCCMVCCDFVSYSSSLPVFILPFAQSLPAPQNLRSRPQWLWSRSPTQDQRWSQTT